MRKTTPLMRLSHLGKHPTPETRAKMRSSHLGKHLTPIVRAKLSEAFKGRIVSSETRAKLSASLKGRICSEETRARMSAVQTERMRSPETRAKIRAAFASPEVRAKMRRVFSTETRAKIRAALLKPETNAKIRINRAQQLCPLKDTKPELAVQELLRDCGINFAKHKCIPGLNHQWDIKIEDRKILIEVDGCYWHGCPVCLLPKARTKQSDIPCTAFATAAGWAVIRIWECEIRAGDFSKLRSLCISVENWKAQSNGR